MYQSLSNYSDIETKAVRNVRGKHIFIGLLLIISSFNLRAQEIEVRGGFLSDSVKIGENINYWLTIKYPESFQAILPDSNYNFTPFELAGKEFYSTRSENKTLIDSAVYTLQTYEIDPVLALKSRAIIFSKGDSIKVFSNPDSVILKQLVSQVSDTTQLITNTSYVDVNTLFNFPLMYYIIGGLLIIALIVVFAFGKKIRRYFQLKKLKKDYAKFSEYITGQIRTIKDNPQPEIAELTVLEWKRYLERLEKKPFTKLTTKEIITDTSNTELATPLREIDKSVYGKAQNEGLYKSFQSLEDFAQHRYVVTIENIKHG